MTVLPSPAAGCEACAARDVVIAEQAEAIGELRCDVTALAGELAVLRRQLGRNSGNSSLPPSGDDQPGRVPAAWRQRRQAREAEGRAGLGDELGGTG